MPSFYDAIEGKANAEGEAKLKYRLNKQFVSPDKIPEVVMAVLTAENIVDENGMIIVEQKNEAAKQPTEENVAELEASNKLKRVDEPKPTPETPAEVPHDPTLDHNETFGPTKTASTDVDDSANEAAPKEELAPELPVEAPKVHAAPVIAPEPPKPAPEPKVPVPAPIPAPKTEESLPTYRSKVPQSKPGMGFPRQNGKTVDIFDGKTPHTHVKLVGGLTVPLSQENYRVKTEGQILARLKELGMSSIDFEDLERKQAHAGANHQPGGSSLLLEDDERDEDIQLG